TIEASRNISSTRFNRISHILVCSNDNRLLVGTVCCVYQYVHVNIPGRNRVIQWNGTCSSENITEKICCQHWTTVRVNIDMNRGESDFKVCKHCSETTLR